MSRLNDENQHSFRATAVLTGIVGAAVFNKRGGLKALSEGVPKIGKFLTSVADDLSDMKLKDYDANNISRLYKKHIAGDDSTFKALKSQIDNKINLNTSGNNAIASIIKLQEIRKNQDDILRKVFQNDYIGKTANKLVSDYGIENEELIDNIRGLTKRVIEKGDLSLYQDKDSGLIKWNEKLIDRFLDATEFSLEENNGFFDDLLDAVESKEIAYNEYKASHADGNTYDIIKSMTEQFTGKNFADAFGTSEDAGIIDELIGQRSMTFGDFMDNIDKFEDQYIKVSNNSQVSLKELVTDFMAEHDDIQNVLIDAKNLKIDKDNNIVNLSDINKYKDGALRGFAGTLPGKLLKTADYLGIQEAGLINFFDKGNASEIMASIDGGSKTLNNQYIQIMNKYYRVGVGNKLSHVEEMNDFYSMSNRHGTMPRLFNTMFGLSDERVATNKLFDKLDIGTTGGSTVIDHLINSDGILGKIARKNYGGTQYNIIDKILDEGLAKEDPHEYRKNLLSLSSVFSNITTVPSNNSISRMKNAVTNDISREILNIISTSKTEEDMLTDLSRYSSKFINEDLNTIVTTAIKDRDKASKILSIKSDKVTGAKNIFNFSDMIKREAFKEAMIQESFADGTRIANHNRIINAIESAGIKNRDAIDNISKLTHWSVLQYQGKLYNNYRGMQDLRTIIKGNEQVVDLLLNERKIGIIPKNVSFVENFKNTVSEIKKDYSDLTSRVVGREETQKRIRGVDTNNTIAIRKAYKPIDYIKDTLRDLNDAEKIKANSKRFGMQFIAGKNNPEYITTYTAAPYFFVDRLAEPFKPLGLAFSSKNTSDVLSYSKNIGAKRIAVAALGLSAFSYLNYETKNFTGTSITGAMAQGVANVDLGLRRIADATGIGYILNAERRLNPMTQYWLGEDYQDYEERKDYYENGYDAVRKGRWWAFGSASEFRGGKISYFQPNYVKRAISDWRDEGLYGGSDEKWKHSWLPTPRHPLAPLRRALDPYWLERKHYYDRPYLETAPLFSTGTPWGALLNPTLGEIVKPVRKMHRNETRRGLVDPRTLIAERNARLKARAVDKDKENLFKISKDGITNISYTSNALANPGTAMVTIQAGNGAIQNINYNGIDYPSTVMDAKDFTSMPTYSNDGIGSGGETGEGNYVGTSGGNNDFNVINLLETSALGSQISNIVNKYYSPIDSIASVNAGIKQKGASNQGVQIQKVNLATMPARMASTRITTRQDESDLLLTTSKHDFISDIIFSGKQLSGIYGFLGEKIFGNDVRKIRPENADNMSSFKRAFWDANVGGLGGGVMEIARRFFPHNDHSWTDINPIRNTMPDWMPDRFKVGDPYTKLPKGEMRLPGRGYESIHKLRPDEYGQYGALDRMRILADIAPWSDEYKIWRDIAKKTTQDAKGKKEIEDIKRRVEKQSRSHEFYPYKFLGNPTEIKSATVASVNGTTIETTAGQSFNIAGIKLSDKNALSTYLQEGTNITVEHLKGRTGDNGPVQAAIYVDGNNVSQSLINSKQATRKDDGSIMSTRALTGQWGQIYGATMEAIAHAPIPFVHSKLMRVDTPLESYKNERLYGTPYSTWDHPIKGFIMPAFQKAWGRGAVGQGIGLGAWYLAEQVWSNPDKVRDMARYAGFDISSTGVNKIASVVFNALNPGAFAGSMIGAIPTGLMGSEGLKGMFSADVFGAGVKSGTGRTAARLGATAMIAGYGITRADNPIKSTAIFSLAGVALANQLNHKSFTGDKGALYGAMAGLAISAIKNPRFDKQKMFGVYTPKSTKKRWDIEEYFDRLEYIKYHGLYEKASRKAKFWERTDIKKLIDQIEYTKKVSSKRLEKIDKKISRVSNSSIEDSRKQHLIDKLNSEKYKLQNPEVMLRGGKYSKAAIAYKQAMDSTIYGLKDNATTQQVLRAIPKADKDYFMEFMKEKDPKKRKEILKHVSPYQRRALQIAWGEKNIDGVESNSSYFRNHFMPGTFWAGWSPQVDMENVKIKTIENEGMLLSDFGIYESQRNEPAAMMAPSVGKDFDKNNTTAIGLQGRLISALNGAGLLGVKVSVSPTSASGIEVITNITNAAKITEYKVRSGVEEMVGARMFY